MFGTVINIIQLHACSDGLQSNGFVAVAEAPLSQAQGLHEASCIHIMPGLRQGLEKWCSQHEDSRGRLLKTILESWKQEMFNQSLREREGKKKKELKNISVQPGCLWNPCSVYYDAEFQLAVLLKTAGTHYLRINTEPVFILKLTRCWELSLMRSCCCQLHNPHQRSWGKITSLYHSSYFRTKAS